MSFGFEILCDAFVTDIANIDKMFTARHRHLCLAGNIVNGDDRSTMYAVVARALELYETVYYIPGKYEYESRKYTVDEISKFLRRLGRQYARLQILIDDYCIDPVNRIVIYGTPLWKRSKNIDVPVSSKVHTARNRCMTSRECNLLRINALLKLQKFLDTAATMDYDVMIISSMLPEGILFDGHTYIESDIDTFVKSDVIKCWVFGGRREYVMYTNY